MVDGGFMLKCQLCFTQNEAKITLFILVDGSEIRYCTNSFGGRVGEKTQFSAFCL